MSARVSVSPSFRGGFCKGSEGNIGEEVGHHWGSRYRGVEVTGLAWEQRAPTDGREGRIAACRAAPR